MKDSDLTAEFSCFTWNPRSQEKEILGTSQNRQAAKVRFQQPRHRGSISKERSSNTDARVKVNENPRNSLGRGFWVREIDANA